MNVKATKCERQSAVLSHTKLDGKYSEKVQLPAKAKFGSFVANTWQHLPHLHMELERREDNITA